MGTNGVTEEGSSETLFLLKKASGCIKILKSLRGDRLNESDFAELNINSIRNKIEFPVKQFLGNLNVLIILGTKINDSFPIGNFVIG